MDEKQFSALQAKLDTLIKLSALSAVQGKSLKEQVAVLASLNMSPKQIADILGKTPNHISVVLHELRKAEIVSKESVVGTGAPTLDEERKGA